MKMALFPLTTCSTLLFLIIAAHTASANYETDVRSRASDIAHVSRWAQLSEGPNVCDITVYGGVGDNKTDCTVALRNALTNCTQLYPDGAVIYLSPAAISASPNTTTTTTVYRITESIRVVSNVTILIGANVVLFSAQWPDNVMPQPPPGCSNYVFSSTAVLCGANATNVAVVGASMATSVVDGGGWPWYDAKLFGKGPRLFEMQWTKNITLSHVTFRNSPSWTVHPIYCDIVEADHIQILNPRFTPNTDGFDPDSSTNVVLRDSFIDTGDDGISIKSGNVTVDGKSVMMPASNIHIYRSVILSRNVCVGSATFGGVYNITVEDCRIGDDLGSCPWAIKYKSHLAYPGPMVNHTYRRLTLGKIAPNTWQQEHGGTAFIIGLSYGHPPPAKPQCPPMCPLFKDVSFEDIVVTGAKKTGSISGASYDHLQGLSFRNVTFKQFDSSWSCSNVDNVLSIDTTPSLTCSNTDDRFVGEHLFDQLRDTDLDLWALN